MSDQQQTGRDDIQGIFAMLSRPFEPNEVRSRMQGGRELHYVTASTVANRLDDVLGMDGWEFELRPWGDDALIGTLKVRLPDGRWVAKSSVGGCAEMAEGDNDAKSADSDCLKRCAARFGVARYLYRSGMPAIVESILGIRFEDHLPRQGGGGYQPQGNGGGRQQASPAPRQQPNGSGDARPAPGMPRDGKGLFMWAKDQEKAGHTNALKDVNTIIEQHFGRMRTIDLTPDQVATIWPTIVGTANAGAGQGRRNDSDIPF